MKPAQPRTKKPQEEDGGLAATASGTVRTVGVGSRGSPWGSSRAAVAASSIRPDEPWDLGHDDLDRSLPRAPEHRRCNRATRAHAAKRRKRRSRLYGPRVRSREW